MLRATKIVATLGPATESPDVLEKLLLAGVDVVRLNFSHGAPQDHRQRAQTVRDIAQKHALNVAIMVDLQGPKIRIGKFENNKVELKKDQEFILDADCKLGNEGMVGLDYQNLPQDVRPQDKLLLNDGLIVLEVLRVVDHKIITKVIIGGTLSNNKGINKQGGGLTAPALTAKDMEDIKTAMELKADYIAVSFPKDATDMAMAKQLAHIAGESHRHKTALIAKIERAEAIPALQLILDVSDGIMVARGDLAVEVGNAFVPALQKRMINMARASDKVVITATQMMESMIVNPAPTRAEVSDVANAVIDGTDAVMLSAETAAGQYPVETVQLMASICQEAENSLEVHLDKDLISQRFTRIDQSIAIGALFTAYHLGCKAIVALTESGSTAQWMSRHTIDIPIYALSSQPSSLRRMALFRNVRSILMPSNQDRDSALTQAEEILKHHGVLQSGDYYAITCGEPMGSPGGTNMLKMARVK